MPTRRRERNQQLFRQVNERIREVGAGFDVTLPDGLDFICECGEASCADILQLTLQEYEQLPRTGPYLFGLARFAGKSWRPAGGLTR
jgi:hypothetical protein